MLIAMNAGHCPGKDPGRVGKTITEAELTRDYVQLINKYLNAAGVDTIFIQEDSLSAICAIANDNDADLFLSLHFNGATSPSATGTETFYCKGSKYGQIFAECVQNQLTSTLQLPDRGIKTDSLYVTRNTNMVAILTEVGFLSNPTEEKFLIARKDDACRAIARGVTDAINKIYGEASDVQPTKSTPSQSQPTQLKPGMVSKYFAANEVCCHHCGKQGATPELLQFLDDLREAIGRPLYVTSVYRCPVHNAEVGGVPNSQHTKGTAADTYCDGLTVDELADIGIRLGADGIGRYYGQQFVHFDVRNGRNYSQIEWTG